MMIRSYLTGAHHVPDEQLREVVLEEHLECGCQCDPVAALNCAGKFNGSTCECECDHQRFGQVSSVFSYFIAILGRNVGIRLVE